MKTKITQRQMNLLNLLSQRDYKPGIQITKEYVSTYRERINPAALYMDLIHLTELGLAESSDIPNNGVVVRSYRKKEIERT